MTVEALTRLRVRDIDPHADPRWEHFVARHPEGLIWHHPAWLQVLEQQYDRPLVTLACEAANGDLQGILPLCHTRRLPLGLGGDLGKCRLSSLPRTPIGGPLALNGEAAAALVRAACASAQPSVLLELKPPASSQAIPGMQPLPWSTSYVLHLPSDVGRLRFGNARTHGSIKRAVNKSIGAGVRVRAAETESDLRAWYRLYLETLRAHGVPPRPYSFFLAAWRVLRPRGLLRLLLAEKAQAGSRLLLAGSVFLMYGHTVVFAFNGRSSRHLALRPNDAIQWRAIHDACIEGFRRFDFGEDEPDKPGLTRFKRKWGAEPHPLIRYYVPPLAHQCRPAPSTDRAARLRRAVWRRVPLSATEVIGSALYRYA